jgi:hypothetical protein
VWEALERYWKPIREKWKARAGDPERCICGAVAIQSRAARTQEGFPDAERLVKRLVAQELTLSFVPDVEQRLWRTVIRKK